MIAVASTHTRRTKWLVLAGLLALAGCPRDKTAAVDAAIIEASVDADTVTHASEAYDSGPAVLTDESIDGQALRVKHRARIAADHDPVTILVGSSAHELGRRICEAKVPKRDPSTPILLKPNIGGFDYIKNGADDGVKGRTTDPEFTRGVIKCLKARGFTKITVAEGWGATHKDWERLAKVGGYEKMCKEESVPLVAMDDDGVFDVEGDKPGKPMKVLGMDKTNVPTLLMPKILAEHLDHGMFISLPKVKAHRFAVFSLGIKGTQGTIDLSDASPAFNQKWRMHKEIVPLMKAQKLGEPEDRAAWVHALEIFGERIADALEINLPDVVLAEGAPAMGGDGFQKLFPSDELYAIGGTNVVLVDRIGAQMLGMWDNADLARELGGHTTSPLLEAAARKLEVDISSPAVDGDGKGLLDKPRRVDFDAMMSFSIHTEGAASTAGKPQVHAAPLGPETITVDGKSDDPAWKRATAATWDTDWSGKKTSVVTHARFVWSKDVLYALLENDGARLFADATAPTSAERPTLYKEDCDELFLAPSADHPKKYFELELGPLGHYMDASIDREASPPKIDLAWSSGVVSATRTDAIAHTSTIEARIPNVVSGLAPGDKLQLGLFRMEGKDKRLYLAWSPTRTNKPDFHVPDAFGALIIDP